MIFNHIYNYLLHQSQSCIKLNDEGCYLIIKERDCDNFHLRVDRTYSNSLVHLSPAHYTNELTRVHIYFSTLGDILKIVPEAKCTPKDIETARLLYAKYIVKANNDISNKEQTVKYFMENCENGMFNQTNLDRIKIYIDDLISYFPYRRMAYNLIKSILKNLPRSSAAISSKDQKKSLEANTEPTDAYENNDQESVFVTSAKIESNSAKLIKELESDTLQAMRSQDLNKVAENMNCLFEMNIIYKHNISLAKTCEKIESYIIKVFNTYIFSKISQIFDVIEPKIPDVHFQTFLDKVLNDDGNMQDSCLILRYLYGNSVPFRNSVDNFELKPCKKNILKSMPECDASIHRKNYMLLLYLNNKFDAFAALLTAGFDPNTRINGFSLTANLIIYKELFDGQGADRYLKCILNYSPDLNKLIFKENLQLALALKKEIAGSRDQCKLTIVNPSYINAEAVHPMILAYNKKYYSDMKLLLPHLNFSNCLWILSRLVTDREIILRKSVTNTYTFLKFAKSNVDAFCKHYFDYDVLEGISYMSPISITLLPFDQEKQRDEFYDLLSMMIARIYDLVAEVNNDLHVSSIFAESIKNMNISILKNDKESFAMYSKFALFTALFCQVINGSKAELIKFIAIFSKSGDECVPFFDDLGRMLLTWKPSIMLMNISSMLIVGPDIKIARAQMTGIILALKSIDSSGQIIYASLTNDSNFCQFKESLLALPINSNKQYDGYLYRIFHDENWDESLGFFNDVIATIPWINKIVCNQDIPYNYQSFCVFSGGQLNDSNIPFNGVSFRYNHYLYIQYDNKFKTGVPFSNLTDLSSVTFALWKSAVAMKYYEILKLLRETKSAMFFEVDPSTELPDFYKDFFGMQPLINAMAQRINDLCDISAIYKVLRNKNNENLKAKFNQRLAIMKDQLRLDKYDDNSLRQKKYEIFNCLNILILHGAAIPVTTIKNKLVNWYYKYFLQALICMLPVENLPPFHRLLSMSARKEFHHMDFFLSFVRSLSMQTDSQLIDTVVMIQPKADDTFDYKTIFKSLISVRGDNEFNEHLWNMTKTLVANGYLPDDFNAEIDKLSAYIDDEIKP